MLDPKVVRRLRDYMELAGSAAPVFHDIRDLIADWERRGEALWEMHTLLPGVMDALESDADKGKRRAAFESIQDAYELSHPWGAALEGKP